MKDIFLFVVRRCLLTYVIRIQKKTSTRMSCLLNRTISHSQSVRVTSSLNTSQILKSRMVFKSQYPLICDRMFNTYETHTFCLRDRGFRLVFSYKTTLYVTAFSYEYSRRISREDRNPYLNYLNDEQLFGINLSRIIICI